jgi:stearoyl-CoA desaturase (Delta-9 desaturase)
MSSIERLHPSQPEETIVQVSAAVNQAMDNAKDSVEKTVAAAREQVEQSLACAKEHLELSKQSIQDTATRTSAATRSAGARIFRSLISWFDTSAGEASNVPISEDRINWLRVLPFLGVHLMCLGVFFVGFSWFALGVAVFMYIVRMFAITGFYHRYFSHKSYKTSRAMQFIMGLWGACCVQRGPLWWASHHRHHHKTSDEPADFHSPVQHGFWWSHMGWIMGNCAFKTDERQVPDLAKFPELRWLDRYDMVIPIALGAVMLGLGMALERFAPGLGTNGPQLLIWGFFVSTVALFHGTVTINSLSHVWGNRRYDTKDDSRNNWFLAIITLGEGWHNNHHHFPGSARAGFFWWEYDLTYYGLRVMSFFGLIWDLKPVPPTFKHAHRKKN